MGKKEIIANKLCSHIQKTYLLFFLYFLLFSLLFYNFFVYYANSEVRPIPGPRLMLNEIDLSGNNLSNEGLACIAAKIPFITTAKLSRIDSNDKTGHLTDSCGPMLVRAWPHLQDVDFSGCTFIGDSTVKDIVSLGGKYDCSLKKIMLGGCNVSEIGTAAIASRCDSLIELDLTGCKLKESDLNKLLKDNSNLKIVRLDFVHVEDSYLDELRRKFKNVILLHRRKVHFEKPPPRVWVQKDVEKGKKGKKNGKKKKKKKR